MIQETVAASRDTLSFNDLLKKLIYKHRDADASSVADFMTALMQIRSPKARILAVTALVKANKEAKVDNLLELASDESLKGLCGKLVLYSALRIPKKAADQA